MHDPIGSFLRIRDLFITYLETAFRINDPDVSFARRALLERPGTLCAEPLIEPIPRYEAVDFHLHELANDQTSDDRLPGFSSLERQAFVELALSGLLESEPAPANLSTQRVGTYHLYQHQAKTLLRGVGQGRPTIVTSGTGSGKTEAFLLPVLAMLAKEAVHWSPAKPGYLRHRWWQDATGQPYSEWSEVPNRPSRRNPNTSPFRLHRDGEPRDRPTAMRALILYPMNALVEDQMTRIRKSLDSDLARATMDECFNHNRLFFARYTSDTKVTGFHVHPRPRDDEHLRRATKLQELFHDSVKMQITQDRGRELDRERAADGEETRFLFPSVDGGELTSRWDIQQTPPDLLITNIAMLNAILAREVDAPLLNKTRDWLIENDDAYFFLILDELHLQRGSAGTEVCYLLKLLFDRLGLTDPAHRHKLRIVASSASLPMSSEGRKDSLEYLWDMFGRHGTWSSADPVPGANSEQDWVDCVIEGVTIDASPKYLHQLKSKAFRRFIKVAGGTSEDCAKPIRPDSVRDAWQDVYAALGLGAPDASVDSKVMASQAIGEAALRIAHACWSTDEHRPKATKLSDLSRRIFGSADVEAAEGMRGLLFVRGLGDQLLKWWPEVDVPTIPSFRVHTFFRSIEGLFAPIAAYENGEGAAYNERRSLVGTLTVDRGMRFDRVRGDSSNRVVELLYCESCGDLFLGGIRGGRADATVELLPSEPDLEGLPDKASQQMFELLSHDDYAVFWPSNEHVWPTTNSDPERPRTGTWVRAAYYPATARVERLRVSRPSQGAVVFGYLFHRQSREADRHRRTLSSAGTAVPYECPACNTDYGERRSGSRLSPIRNFRTGFAKTTQLLATEVFDVLRIQQREPKLVSFSDSRQDAAKAALDIEARHHEDLRREILIDALRALNGGQSKHGELESRLLAIDKRITELVHAGRMDDVQALWRQRDELKEAIGRSVRDYVPVSDVLESLTGSARFYGPAGARDKLRPLLAAFVSLGVHPTDPAGVKRIPGGSERDSTRF